jgi:2-oxoisovalerate dehydrogenase E1 component beta subunit
MVSEAAKIHYRSNGDFHVPMVVRTPWGGGGHRGPYHSQSIEAFFAHVAGLKVVVPSTPSDVAGLLRSAVEDPDPVLFLEHKKTYRRITGLVPGGDWRVPIGLASVARTGRLLVVHEDNISFGVGAEVAAIVAEEAFYDLDAPVRRLAMADVPAMPYDVVLESALTIGADAIRAAAKSLMEE